MVGCGNCCRDLVIPIQHLMFPDVFLDDAGKEFMQAHGFRYTEMVTFEYQGLTYTVNLLGLIRPDLYLLNDADLQFYHTHLHPLVKSNVTVRVLHTCSHLSKGLCDIYATRPQICRAFSCADRSDCTIHHPLKVKL